MDNNEIITGYVSDADSRRPRRHGRRRHFFGSSRTMILLGIVCAVALCGIIVLCMHLSGWRYRKTDIGNGEYIKYLGVVKNGELVSGKITYSSGLTGVKNKKTGVITYSDRSQYFGEISEDGRKNGEGSLSFHGGTIYRGTFVNDEMTGQAEITYSNGDSYSGAVVNGVKEGRGRYVWADGSVYEGNFSNDKKNGQGTYDLSDGSRYEGDYVNDKKEGEGIYRFTNGDVYTGHFSNDMRNGTGTYVWANGETYTGDFLDNNITGNGRYTWPSGRIFDGKFENGKMVR